jgi:hypothetical protein
MSWKKKKNYDLLYEVEMKVCVLFSFLEAEAESD